MPDIPIQAAIELARKALSLESGIPARAEFVSRLDRSGAGYYLVSFGARNATVGLAAVDPSTGDVLSHARVPGSGFHEMLAAEEARLRTGTIGAESTRLVWRPCRASFSMLYPLWEIATLRGLVYVDQQGRLWTELEPGGPGG